MKTPEEIISESKIAVPDENHSVYGNALSDDLIKKWIDGATWVIESSQSSIEEEIKTGSLSFVTWINNKQYYESRHMNQYSVWFRQDGESVANSTEELYEIYQNGPMKEENNQLNNKQ